MQKRQIFIVLAAIGVLALAGALSAFFASQKEPPQQKRPKQVKNYVKTSRVSYEDIETEVQAFGRVQSAQSLDLLSEVAGRMYEGNVRLKEGQSFKKGTLLFYIDTTEPELNLKSQKSNFLRDLAAILPDLKIDYSENFEAWDKYFSRLDIDKTFPPLPEVKSEKEKTFLATQGIYSAYYTIKSAEARLDKHRYYAPFDGSISEVVVESGAFINPGTRIGTIIRSGLHELKVAVETSDIPWIQQGSPAKVYSDETQQVWEGKVTRISDYVNQNTQSIDVFISLFPNKGQRIYDGQFLEASIPARTVKDGMVVPRNIIYNGSEVFVLQDTLLKTRQVNIYRTMDESAIIGGLDEGTDLVIEPLVGAHNNMVAYKAEQRDIDMETGSVSDSPEASNKKAQ